MWSCVHEVLCTHCTGGVGYVRLRPVILLQSSSPRFISPYLQSLKSNSGVQGLVFRGRLEEASVSLHFRNVINEKLILLQNPVLKKNSLNVFF